VTKVVGSEGYPGLTAERVLAAGGLSRATFYQYFSNVDDCFWSAYREHADQLVRRAEAAVRRGEPRELAVLDTLVEAAICRPEAALLLMTEGLAAGPAGLG
jgi:AcrR family transcriptional regulator